jgi:hypothetical protein
LSWIGDEDGDVPGLSNGVGALKLLGYRFRYVESPVFDEVVLLGSFAWPDHYDRVLISSSATGFAIRTSSPAGETWICQGDAASVVWALVNLAPPIHHDDQRCR